MTPRKRTILAMLLGLLLFAFAVAIAQTPAQGDQKSKTESCCAMESCCCNSGSCPMKAEGSENAEAKEGCCSGDSCKMKAKDGAKSHADHKGCACCGDSCDMKHEGKSKSCCKHTAKNKKAA